VTRVLLDTHAFLWAVADDARLSPRARRAISDAGERFLSLASCWEMAIKVSLRRLALKKPVDTFVFEQLGLNPFRLLPIELDDIAHVSTLTLHHRDPFDRLLAAQALGEDLTIVSADPIFRKYGVKRIW
jgi:PIN domain nuclease of toxin-antitoxin system